MKVADLKGIFGKFAFIKDYAAIAVPAIIAVVAALMFIPTTFMQQKLAKKIKSQSATRQITIQSLADVPSARQAGEQEKRDKALRVDANKIGTMESNSSMRELISYDVLPEPAELSQQLFNQFASKYRKSLDDWAEVLKARDCPSADELSKSLKRNVAAEEIENSASIAATDKLIIDDLCMKVAKNFKVYFEQTDLSGYRLWKNYNYTEKESAIEDCWFAQIAYWIIEDCLQTVKELNLKSSCVLDAKVKRIVDIGFTAEQDSSASSPIGPNLSFMTQNRFGRPEYVTSLDSGLTLPLTARISNDRLDVVHFRISVVVNARSVPSFLEQLCGGKEHKFKGFHNELAKEETFRHNQITILKYNFGAVNTEDKEHRLYRYGPDATVKLDLLCEYIFDKKGYDSIKPASVRKKLEGMIQKTAL